MRPAVAVVALVAVIGACSPSSSGGGLRIVSFTIPPTVKCAPGAIATSASAQWQTTGAEGVGYTVDADPAGPQAGMPTSGIGEFRIACNVKNKKKKKPQKRHKVVFSAYGANGKTVSKTVTVTES